MKVKQPKIKKHDGNLRKEILNSMLASFKIEGILIPLEKATKTLQKVELNLGKSI